MLLSTLSRLFQLVQFVKCWQIFLELNLKRLYWSSGKEKESCCPVFTSLTKQEIRHVHVVVVCSKGKEISCGFANLNLLLFRRSLLPPLLKLPNNLILGNLNGALIFSEFEQILAIKMAAIQGIFNKDQQPAKFTSYFTWTRYLLFFGNYPSFFQITRFKTDTETTNGSKLLARRNKFKKYM